MAMANIHNARVDFEKLTREELKEVVDYLNQSLNAHPSLHEFYVGKAFDVIFGEGAWKESE